MVKWDVLTCSRWRLSWFDIRIRVLLCKHSIYILNSLFYKNIHLYKNITYNKISQWFQHPVIASQYRKVLPLYSLFLCFFHSISLTNMVSTQGRIQDFVLEGTKVGEGSGDRLRSPACPGSPGPREVLGFEYLGSFSVSNFEAFCECDEVY